MDPELSQASEALEQRIRHGVAGEIQASETRMRDFVGAAIRASAEKTRQHVDASAQETRRHASVLAEGLRADFRVFTEAIMSLDRRLGALQEQGEHTAQRLDLLENRVAALERSGKTRRRRQ